MSEESKLKAKLANWQWAMSSMMKRLNKRITAKFIRRKAKKDAYESCVCKDCR